MFIFFTSPIYSCLIYIFIACIKNGYHLFDSSHVDINFILLNSASKLHQKSTDSLDIHIA